jgi:NADH-quinone oxidoreductase subunit F
MVGNTICAFGDAAAAPIVSYVKKFRNEFEYHIQNKQCDIHPDRTPSLIHNA